MLNYLLFRFDSKLFVKEENMFESIRTDKLIVSDIHIGSEECRAKELFCLLTESSYNEVIILGDLYQKGEITDEQLDVLMFLRDHRSKVRYVDGNHDRAGETIIHGLIRIGSTRTHKWQIGERLALGLHGDQVDRWCFLFNHLFVDRLSDYLMKLFRELNWPLNGPELFARWHEEMAWHFARSVAKYSWKRHKALVALAGHIHMPGHFRVRFKGVTIEYINCGCCMGKVFSFATVDKDNCILLRSLENGEVKTHPIVTLK